MRIGIDCRLWNETGVGRYIRNLVHNLQKIDKENEYVLFVLSKDAEEVKQYVAGSQWRMVVANIRWHTFEEQWKFSTLLQKEKLDLVHFPYFSLPVSYPGKFVVTIHDLILHHFPTGQASTHNSLIYKLKLLGYKYVVLKAAQRAGKIITVTEATKNDIVQTLHVSSEKIAVTREGVDNQISDAKYRISNMPKNYFLYVGNAYPHKNLERLIGAFRRVQLEHNETKLVLIGKEDFFYKRIRDLIKRLKLEEHILVKGYVDDEELASCYRGANALVVPSLLEGFGLPGIEAMQQECLVLASDIPVLHEVYGGAAVYFNPENEAALVDAMDSVFLADHKVKKKEGIAQVKKFSWEKMAKETLNVYNSLLITK